MTPSTVFYVHWSYSHVAWVASTPDSETQVKSDDGPAAALWILRNHMQSAVDRL